MRRFYRNRSRDEAGGRKGGGRAPLFHKTAVFLIEPQRFFQDPRRDKDQELVAVVKFDRALEQDSHVGQIAQQRHLGHRRAFVLGVNPADHDRAAVLDQNLGGDLLGIDTRA